MRAILLGSCIKPQQLSVLLPLLKIAPTDYLVGVDDGVRIWLECGFEPNFAVGDWDSYQGSLEVLEGIPHLTLKTEKDRSDLYYAAQAAIQMGAQELICLGVTGGRTDHHLAAIYDLSEIASKKLGKSLRSIQIQAVEAEYHFLSAKSPLWKRTLPPDKLISFFAMGGPARGVSLTGFRYPLKNEVLLPSSRGLSNQVLKGKCEVRLRKGQLLVIMPRNGFNSSVS